MKNKKYILLFALPLLFASCDSFLTETPEHNWSVGEVMQNYSNAQQSVNGIYGEYMNMGDAQQYYYLLLATKSGLINIIGDNALDFTYKEENSPSGLWTAMYSVINDCNFAINGIPEVPEKAFPTEAARTELIAEARFLRGYFYSIVLLNYCCWYAEDASAYGLVYKDLVSDMSNQNTPRITVGESWTKVMEDIDFGIENMSDEFVTPRKASKFFAKAYKAKLLLIRGTMRGSEDDIAQAKTLVDDCLSHIPAAVSVCPDMAQVYADAWDSPENIFVRYLEDNAYRTSYAGYYSNYALGYTASSYMTDSKGNEVSQTEAEMGVKYGHDWLSADPRWLVGTGKARMPETWDNTYKWVWTKIFRKGRYEGQLEPKDEKYAVYHLRIPELYIMQSELIARTGGSVADAIAPINKYRAMRTNPVLDQIPVPASKEALMDVIFQEYIKETILENGTEFWASLRFQKDGKTYMEAIKGAGFTFDKSLLQLPVPHSEMINNSALVGMQNPGQE